MKKEEIKGRKFLQRDGAETSLSSSLFFIPTVVRVVSHSAIQERCMVASRLARPLSTRIKKGIGDDTAQIVLYSAMWRVLLSVEHCFCK